MTGELEACPHVDYYHFVHTQACKNIFFKELIDFQFVYKFDIGVERRTNFTWVSVLVPVPFYVSNTYKFAILAHSFLV